MDTKKDFDTGMIRGTVAGALAGLSLLAVVLPGGAGTSHAAVRDQVEQVAIPPTETLPPSAPLVLPPQLDLGDAPASADAQRLAQWVLSTADNGSMPFVVLDKLEAHIFVFTAHGRLLGSAPVLLGYARGDHTVPGIGDRPLALIRPEERTTPAGRFLSEPGRNHVGEEVVWVDYDAAVSMHRVRLGNPAERRAERLASPTVADNRISYGCINLPVEFFERVVWPTLRDRHGVVYVLPEMSTLEEAFPGLVDFPSPALAAVPR
jgi:hypothetical protein